MLIDFEYLVNKYEMQPKRILHLGAHKAEEMSQYINMGAESIHWVEANPVLCDELKVSLNPTVNTVTCAAVSDVSGKRIPFYVTNNGESSSILEMDLHVVEHPTIHVVDTIQVTTQTVDDIMGSDVIFGIDFFALDIQGAELLAMCGAKHTLAHTSYIYTEINTKPLYKGCAVVDELDKYLRSFGFSRTETMMTVHGWGDALYVKS